MVKARKGQVPHHQGLLKLLYNHAMDNLGIGDAELLRSGFSRSNGTPILKAQLLLGVAPKLVAESGIKRLAFLELEKEEPVLEQEAKKEKGKALMDR